MTYVGLQFAAYTLEILSGVAGIFLGIFLVIAFIAYRNWKYEQELDSLLWKVDYKEIEMNDPDSNSTTSKISRVSELFRLFFAFFFFFRLLFVTLKVVDSIFLNTSRN